MKKKEIIPYKIDYNIYKLNELNNLMLDFKSVKTSKGIEYLNIPFDFDIETTSFYQNKLSGNIVTDTPLNKNGEFDDTNYNRCNIMYAFVFGINGKQIIARNWDDFTFIIDTIVKRYDLSMKKRIIVWVHNLSYEFQYLSKRFEWDTIFALDTREVIKAITTSGIEFRCSYALSGYSLEHIGEKILHKYIVKKAVGDLDYTLLRHNKTILTDKELYYILCDGLVVSAYIQEKIEEYTNVTRIPLTKTGVVRRLCRKKCLGGYKTNLREVHNYKKLMKYINITDSSEYKQLKRAFHGGFTHANALKVNEINYDVSSYDFTSSYPAVMLYEKYPMSKAFTKKLTSKEDFENCLKKYCCIFDIEIFNLSMKENVYENPLSFNKCIQSENAIINNGRVSYAKRVLTTITNVDYKILKAFYNWDKIRIYNFKYYYKDYLPKSFIMAILEMYEKKTKLKGVSGEEVDYMNSKENLNACYGMCVTDICRDEILFNQDDYTWSSKEVDIDKSIEKYNNSIQRFLCYQWGIFITAYAMRNLFTGIYELGDDYIYSDTDSIKYTNKEKHTNYIERYNKIVEKKLIAMCNHYDIDKSLIQPKTIKGETKLIGVWDYEGTYKRFKTLGAKRYLYEDYDGNLHLTCSGLNKKIVLPYFKEKYKTNDNIFNHFTQNLYIPSGKTGKNIHTYIDNIQQGFITDYQGVKNRFYELSSIHMCGAMYNLSITNDFIDYILKVKEKYYNS